MKTLIILLLGVKLNYVSFPMKFDDCFDSAMYVIEQIATYHKWTDKEQYQGYYTDKGRLVIGHYCK